MKYGILILTILFTTQLFAENSNKAPQVLRVACQGMRFGEPVDTVVILTQQTPDKKNVNELIDHEEFESTTVTMPFKLQMLDGKVNLTEIETIVESTKNLLKNTKPGAIQEAEVVASRFYRQLKFKSSNEDSHYFEMDLMSDYNKYNGNFIKYMKFQCSKPFYVDFKEPKPGMQNKSGNVQIDTIQDGDACTVGVDPECVDADTMATN